MVLPTTHRAARLLSAVARELERQLRPTRSASPPPCRWRWPLRRNRCRRTSLRRLSTIAASRRCSGLRGPRANARDARAAIGFARGEVATRTTRPANRACRQGGGLQPAPSLGLTRSSAAPPAGPNPGGAGTAVARRGRSRRGRAAGAPATTRCPPRAPRRGAAAGGQCRSSRDISRARSSCSDVPLTSAGATVSASCASCSAAPAVSDRTRTGSRSPTSTASFATRFMPSRTGLTSTTSARRSAAIAIA